MSDVRTKVAQFIEAEGHRTDVTILDDAAGVAEILFRTRGQMFSITTYETNPLYYTVSTAYEIPEWAREDTGNVDTLQRVQRDYPDIQFVLAHDDALFVVTLEVAPGSPESFAASFWDIVRRVREAGSKAVERIVDRTESKKAADKFINSFIRGER